MLLKGWLVILLPFNGCWQKTWDSGVRDHRLDYSQHSIVSVPLVLRVLWGKRVEGPMGGHWAKKSTIFIASNKQACSLSWRGGIISSLSVVLTRCQNNPEKWWPGKKWQDLPFLLCPGRYIGTDRVLCLLTTTRYPRGSPEFQPSSAPWMARVRHLAKCNNFYSFYPVARGAQYDKVAVLTCSSVKILLYHLVESFILGFLNF